MDCKPGILLQPASPRQAAMPTCNQAQHCYCTEFGMSMPGQNKASSAAGQTVFEAPAQQTTSPELIIVQERGWTLPCAHTEKQAGFHGICRTKGPSTSHQCSQKHTAFLCYPAMLIQQPLPETAGTLTKQEQPHPNTIRQNLLLKSC